MRQNQFGTVKTVFLVSTSLKVPVCQGAKPVAVETETISRQMFTIQCISSMHIYESVPSTSVTLLGFHLVFTLVH